MSSRANVWRTLVFVCFVGPGPVIGLVPWWISGWRMRAPIEWWRYAGLLLVVVGFVPLADCIRRFVSEGNGTPEPMHPTNSLVVSGLYRYVRNPMYGGVVLMILGQAVWFGSVHLVEYALVAWMVMHVFVLLYEEPTLRDRYGAEYDEFRRSVPRWISRMRPAR